MYKRSRKEGTWQSSAIFSFLDVCLRRKLRVSYLNLYPCGLLSQLYEPILPQFFDDFFDSFVTVRWVHTFLVEYRLFQQYSLPFV